MSGSQLLPQFTYMTSLKCWSKSSGSITPQLRTCYVSKLWQKLWL